MSNHTETAVIVSASTTLRKVTFTSDKHEAVGGRIRVNLHDPVNEIASYVVENGAVSFSGLRFGEYVIKILKDRTHAGKFALKIKE